MNARRSSSFVAAAVPIAAASFLIAIAVLSTVTVSTARDGAVGHPPPTPVLKDGGPSLEDVLAAHLEACGGAVSFERIDTRVVTARVITDLPTWERPVFEIDSLTVYSCSTTGHLMVHRAAQGSILEGFDGADVWKRNADGTVVESQAVRPRDAWLTDPRFAARLTDYFPNMSYLGVAAIDGIVHHVVDVDGDHSHRLYFDEETGLLARLGYNRRILRYVELDGVRIPAEVEYSRKGGSSTYVLDAVAHNVPVDGALFSLPRSY
jgi:hypothetical protein